MHQHKTTLHLISTAILICSFLSACKKDHSPSPPDSIPLISDSTFTIYNTSNSGIPIKDVLGIVSDWDDNIWFRNNETVIRFDGTNWTTYNSSNSSLPPYLINCITCDKNNKYGLEPLKDCFRLQTGNGIS